MSRSALGPVRRFKEIDSTNRYLADEARAGAPHGLVAVAEYQSAGRGRLGRRWEAPPGANLLFSVLLYPGDDPAAQHASTIALALSAADSCMELAAVDPGLKWPNDLVVGDMKLAGVLAESIGETPNGTAVVVGLGLNVGWPAQGPVAPELESATSLARLSDAQVDPDAILTDLIERLGDRLSVPRTVLMEDYRTRCATLGRQVRVEEPSGSFDGVATDLTPEGHLIVASPAGRRVVMAGDVVHLRHHDEPS